MKSQMDKKIASFTNIAKLTKSIVEVSKNSTQLQVDETGEKVRAITKRCTIVLRGIPENADEEEMKSLFNGCPPYKSLSYGLNDSWYVTFSTEDETRKAFVHLQNFGKCFNGKPVYARITEIGSEHKYSPELRGHITIHHEAQIVGGGGRPSSSDTNRGQSPISSNTLSNLGQILSQYGYVPRATFRPSIPIPPPMITMTGPAAMFQPFHSSSPGSFFSQPIISSAMNGGCSFATAMENGNGAEHSGSSRFETSSNSTIGAGVPRVGKHRIRKGLKTILLVMFLLFECCYAVPIKRSVVPDEQVAMGKNATKSYDSTKGNGSVQDNFPDGHKLKKKVDDENEQRWEDLCRRNQTVSDSNKLYAGSLMGGVIVASLAMIFVLGYADKEPGQILISIWESLIYATIIMFTIQFESIIAQILTVCISFLFLYTLISIIVINSYTIYFDMLERKNPTQQGGT